MTIWNNNFLDKIRTYWKDKIDKIQIQQEDSSWVDLAIRNKTIEGNAIVIFTQVPNVQFTTVNIRVIDTDGDVAGVTPESISKTSDDTFYLTFKFSLRQIEN